MSDEKVLEVVAANGFMCTGAKEQGGFNKEGTAIPMIVQSSKSGDLLVKCYYHTGMQCNHPHNSHNILTCPWNEIHRY